jgi:hypothetical protein
MSVPLRCTNIQVPLLPLLSASGCVPGHQAQQEVEGVAGCCAGGGGGGEGCGQGEGGGDGAERGCEGDQEALQVAGVVESACDEGGEEHGGEGRGRPGTSAGSVAWGHGRAGSLELAGCWVVLETSEPEAEFRRKLHFSGL